MVSPEEKQKLLVGRLFVKFFFYCFFQLKWKKPHRLPLRPQKIQSGMLCTFPLCYQMH